MIEAGQPARYAAMTEACWQQWHVRFAMQSVLSKLTQIMEDAVANGAARQGPELRAT
jgi:hypothetical protein